MSDGYKSAPWTAADGNWVDTTKIPVGAWLRTDVCVERTIGTESVSRDYYLKVRSKVQAKEGVDDNRMKVVDFAMIYELAYLIVEGRRGLYPLPVYILPGSKTCIYRDDVRIVWITLTEVLLSMVAEEKDLPDSLLDDLL